MKHLASSMLALSAGAAYAVAQAVEGTFIADPDHGRILRFSMSGGPHTAVFASGSPLVRPVALTRDVWRYEGIFVCDAGAGAVFLMNPITGAIERTLVEPGAGGLVTPVETLMFGSELYVLDGHDGTVRRYSHANGQFLGDRVAPRDRPPP